MSDLPDGVSVAHHFCDGVYTKETFIPAKTLLRQHVHAYDHLSMLMMGHVVLFEGDVRRSIAAPAVLTIKAGVSHSVLALTDVLWCCVHRTDCTDENEVDQSILEG